VLLLKKNYKLLIFGLLAILTNKAFGQALVINAGNDTTVCAGTTVTLGGHPVATGGSPPYTFAWTPAAGLSNPSDSTPTVTVNNTTTYTLTVLDSIGNRQIDSVKISVDSINKITAGSSATICTYLDSAFVGAATNPPSYIYTWLPSAGLDCINCPSTYAKPGGNTTYTLNATDGKCSSTSQVTITVTPPPTVSTTSPVTINRGQSVTLNVTGLTSNIQWVPDSEITGANTATPSVSPLQTITYTVYGKAPGGCYGLDSVVVDVIQDSSLYFYNTFTPNGDGINDTWFIGNIDQFPNNEVVVFNRYGAQIFQATGYDNKWDGTILGVPVPDATYYYVVYTGTGKTYRGSVTIIRKFN